MVVALGALLVPALKAEAQAPRVDHWETREACLAAVTAPYYEPSITCNRELGKEEAIKPHPTGGCFLMELPDRLTSNFKVPGRGWVRIEAGRPFIYRSIDGRTAVSRLAKCCNEVFAEAPFMTTAAANTPTTPPPAGSPPAGSSSTPVTDSAHRITGEVTVRHTGNVKVDHGGSPTTPPKNGNWFGWSRHGKWFWPLTTGVVTGGVLAVTKPFKVIQCVNTVNCPS